MDTETLTINLKVTLNDFETSYFKFLIQHESKPTFFWWRVYCIYYTHCN